MNSARAHSTRHHVLAFLTAASVAAVSLGIEGQSARTATSTAVPRTANGRPDLQGMWTNATLSPLERPVQLSGRLTVSEAEARKYAADFIESNNIDRRDGGAEADVNRAYPDYFLDRGTDLALIDGQRRTSLIVDPANGRIPPPHSAGPGKGRRPSRAAEQLRRPRSEAPGRTLPARVWVKFGAADAPGAL